jgi:hypothetical protein
MQASYYVIHMGSDTIFNLDECKIVIVKDDNEGAQEAVDNNDIEEILNHADAVYNDSEITLG